MPGRPQVSATRLRLALPLFQLCPLPDDPCVQFVVMPRQGS